MTRLIVNADDLGYGEGVNRGIVEAHERGILTSTSLMVDGDAAAHGVELAAARAPRLGIGLHGVVDGIDPDRCADELERQLARFAALVGRPPTHVDSHHHLHREPALAPAFDEFATRNALPLRDREVPHEGGFYGGGSIDADSLLRLLDRLAGVVELGCHPGYGGGLRSGYVVEREVELHTLTDPRVRGRIDELGIELIRWDEL
jgi:chitin disaccharide deacetylase